MNVLFLTHRRDTPSTRYRVSLFLPILREAGIDAEVREIRSGVLERYRVVRDAARYDAVVIQKRLFARPVLGLLRRRARRLVFDFDDAVNLGRDGESRTRGGRFAAMVRAADLTIAGNAYLRDQAAALGAARVEVLPTALDVRRYALHEPKDDAVLGWIGGGGNVPYLETIVPALAAAAAREPRLRLRVISNRFPKAAGVPVESRPWSEERETEDLREVDIGLAPLPDDPWTRGKCGFKILQYMAAAVPVVASPVGVQATIVEHGRTGFLASTPKEWTDGVIELAGDVGKRKAFGLAGRRKVEREFAAERVGAKLAKLLLELRP